MLCAIAGVGCATTQPASSVGGSQRLVEISAIAGKPVSSFRYMGQSQFEPLGLSDLLVFTSPGEAWLLHLDGSCRDLDFGPFLKLTSHMHRVSTMTDSVIVRDNPIPCRIEQIRPVDTAALRNVTPAQQQSHVEIESTIGTQPSHK
jgi:hypothetical protein